jgi:dimethylhistidine N-methyltransferase
MLSVNNDSKEQEINPFISEIEAGLLSDRPYISPKFLYDPLGSHLFTAITLLPEYYPTSTEKSIFDQYQHDMVQAIGKHRTLIDLGAGNCQKAQSLFKYLQPSHYVAIDFSEEYLKDALSKLQAENPSIHMQAIAMDFSHSLSLPSTVPTENRSFFYPGSSLGNFLYPQAKKLLSQIKFQVGDGGLLIGIDLMKEDEVLLAAYDDDLKVTAAFNLNILRSINSVIQSNFDVKKFRHVVKVNHDENRVELYLEAQAEVVVSWPGNQRTFKKGELIHTENSHKYSISSIQELLHQSGFLSTNIWTDPKQYFAVIYAK